MDWLKKYDINLWIFSKTKIFRRKSERWRNLSNYATKADLKNTTRIDALKVAKKVDLASLKRSIDQLDIDKLETALSNHLSWFN